MVKIHFILFLFLLFLYCENSLFSFHCLLQFGRLNDFFIALLSIRNFSTEFLCIVSHNSCFMEVSWKYEN